jgi:hypothetical protein
LCRRDMNRHATNYHPECERARAHPSSHCPHDSLPRMNANEYIRKTSSVDPGTRFEELRHSCAFANERCLALCPDGRPSGSWSQTPIMERVDRPRPMRLPAFETQQLSGALNIGGGSQR